MPGERCRVTHAPGRTYVCWTHQKFMPWSEPFRRHGGCCCDRSEIAEVPDVG